MSLAAHFGHAESMYSLALIHLDGNEFYSSCVLASKLLRGVIERGAAAQYLENGFHLYKSGRIKESLMHYFEAAYLGYELGVLNAAILLDKYPESLNFLFLDFSTFRESIKSNFVYQLLTQKAIIKVEDPITYLYDDCIALIEEVNLQKKIEIFEPLLASEPTNTQYSRKVAYDLYNISAYVHNDNFASLRMGDFYYYGWVTPVNFDLAFKNYLAASMHPNNSFTAIAYFNLGVLAFRGEGVTKNNTLAIQYLDAAANVSEKFVLISAPLKYLLYIEDSSGLNILGRNSSMLEVANWVLFSSGSQAKHSHLGMVLLMFLGILAYLLKIRLRNYSAIYFSQDNF